MKAISPKKEYKRFLNSYVMQINGDRLFFKCLLFFGSILLAGILFFCFWTLQV